MMWKVCVVVVNIWLKRDVDLNDTLHRFQEKRITGTATVEKNLAHQLASIDQ